MRFQQRASVTCKEPSLNWKRIVCSLHEDMSNVQFDEDVSTLHVDMSTLQENLEKKLNWLEQGL